VDCIVLVKQVPDVSSIPDDAWDREHGTLRRALLDNVLNPLDLHALTFARQITGAAPGSRTVYLTMGPPQARDVLIDCVSRVPGEAILLTDRTFAGADTIATAYSLACAIRRIERELLGGRRDYVIVAGMQSQDGDTAQVPPQVAEDLDIEHVAYAQAVEPGPPLRVRRIGPTGIEDVWPLSLPVLVTVTACTETLYRTFGLTRRARTAPIREWGAASVGARPERIGLRGSRTQVYRLFSPSETRRKSCVIVDSPSELVERIRTSFYGREDEEGAGAEPAEGYRLNGRTASRHGELWAFAERDGEGLRDVSLALVGKARELAAPLGERVAAVLVGPAAGELPERLIAHGADTVYAIEHPLLERYDPVTFKKAVSALVRERGPQIMLFGATPLGRELAPRIAYACDSGLTADCTQLEVGDHLKGSVALVGILKQTRPALGGNVMATIMTKDSPTQMATVRPGVFGIPTPDASRQGEIVHIVPDLSPEDIGLRTDIVEAYGGEKSIRGAAAIVAGGHGFRSRADFDAYLDPLARGLARLLGCTVEIGASRRAVEDGFTSHDHQVGQTGQSVHPRLYVAVGISGAVQHISGMQGSDVVVAINKDPRARIFDYADIGLTGNLESVLPEIIRCLDGGSPSSHSMS
jgi:electron transfer flavoprotein alpha subunit